MTIQIYLSGFYLVSQNFKLGISLHLRPQDVLIISIIDNNSSTLKKKLVKSTS